MSSVKSPALLAVSVVGLLVYGGSCGSDIVEGTGTGTDSATGSGTDTGSGSRGDATGSTSSTSGTGTSMGSATGTTGTTGASTSGGSTTAGGSATATGGSSTTAGGGSTTSGGGSTATGGGSTTTGGGGSSTGGAAVCQGLHEITLTAEDASLSGDWFLTMSNLGEGMIARIANGVPDPEGTVEWKVDVPCADTWHIFVRGFDAGSDDSYFVRVDGQPPPPERAIMELDCTGLGGEYRWEEMNWRADGEPVCTYVEDPWTFDWMPGSHDVVFEYRESPAIARIVVTNDPNWQP